MSEMSQASASMGGDPLDLTDAVTEGEPMGEHAPSTSSPRREPDPSGGYQPTDNPGDADPGDADLGSGSPAQRISEASAGDDTGGSDPMPDMAGTQG